jgi:rhodanese-related sulfurtransferase
MQETEFDTVDVAALRALVDRHDPLRLVDVRTPAEYRAIHARGAISIPLDQLDRTALESLPGEGPVYVICRSGARSGKACEQLVREGAGMPVVSVRGGTDAWERAGLPVDRGEPSFTLERQVQVAIGAMVALSVLLGATVHPSFHFLAGLGGLGLVYAGVSGSCPLASVLARMPWNRS